MLGLRLYVCLILPVCQCTPQPIDSIVETILSQFTRSDVVALGEWHWTQEDSDLRIQLVRHPQFPEKVRLVVTECGNALHQTVLDRYVNGENVPQQEFQKLLRDVTSPGGCDSPVYEQFLQEIQKINRSLPLDRKIHVLAGDHPIDWENIRSSQDWRQISESRDSFASTLIAHEILKKQQKALIVYGAGHIYRNMIDSAPRNLVSLLDRELPGRVYTVIRILGGRKNPMLLSLRGTALGERDANEVISRDLPSRWFAEGLKIEKVADAAIYRATDTIMNPPPSIRTDTAYTAEKARRMKLISGSK